MTGTARLFCTLGSVLLLVMAVFHGSGHSMISDAIAESNAASFLKQIVPVLFVHVSMHLVGLAAFGILALFLAQGVRSVVSLVAAVVVADAILAFYLGGAIAGAVLVSAALCFVLAAATTSSGGGRTAATRALEP